MPEIPGTLVRIILRYKLLLKQHQAPRDQRTTINQSHQEEI